MERLQERVLIVDDDPLNVRVLVELLRGEYQLVIARDGAQTLERLTQPSLPDLILLDVMMPGMDGFEVCRQIKANPQWRGIPVIFVTALNQPFDESAAFEAGGVDFITKPLSPAALHGRLRTHLRLRRTERLLLRQNLALDELASERGSALQASEALLVRVLTRLCAAHGLVATDHVARLQRFLLLVGQALLARPGFHALSVRSLQSMAAVLPLQALGALALGLPPAGSAGTATDTLDEGSAARQAHAVQALLAGLPSARVAGAGALAPLLLELFGARAERWDGGGGPAGLAGAAIPLPARLLALADWLVAGWPAGRAGATLAPGLAQERQRALAAALTGSAAGRFDPALVSALLDVPDWAAALEAVVVPEA